MEKIISNALNNLNVKQSDEILREYDVQADPHLEGKVIRLLGYQKKYRK